MLHFICERRSFFHGASSGCASLHGLFFLQKFRKSRRQRQTSRGCKKIRQKFAPAGKSGIIYTRDDSVNLRSPSPDVDGVSDSLCTSGNLRTDGQPEVGRGLPSIDEERKISSIHKTDSPSCSFLSLFLSPAVFAGSGAFAFCRCFAAGRIRHTVCVNTHKKKKGKKSDENNTTRRKSNRVY